MLFYLLLCSNKYSSVNQLEKCQKVKRVHTVIIGSRVLYIHRKKYTYILKHYENEFALGEQDFLKRLPDS